MKLQLTLIALITPWVLGCATLAPQSRVYCHGETTVAFALDRAISGHDVRLRVNGVVQPAMTAYSWYGRIQPPPEGFRFAILGSGDFDPLLVFEGYLLDAKARKYTPCSPSPLK